MIFIWGKKLVYRNLGHVGDFCPMCRVPRAFSVRRVGLAGHIYYITSGEGELVGHERTCKECGIVLNANPATYAGFSKLNLPVNELLALTYPNFAAVMKDRLEVEERVRQGAAFLSPQERAALVQVPSALLSPRVEERSAQCHARRAVRPHLAGRHCSDSRWQSAWPAMSCRPACPRNIRSSRWC